MLHVNIATHQGRHQEPVNRSLVRGSGNLGFAANQLRDPE